MRKAFILLLLLLCAVPAYADVVLDGLIYTYTSIPLYILNTIYLIVFLRNYRRIKKGNAFEKYSIIHLFLCFIIASFFIIELPQFVDFGTVVFFFSYPFIGIVASIYAVIKYSMADKDKNEPSNS